jgi:hypothetical protein
MIIGTVQCSTGYWHNDLKRVVRRRDSSLPTRVCVPLVINKVYKVSTITTTTNKFKKVNDRSPVAFAFIALVCFYVPR